MTQTWAEFERALADQLPYLRPGDTVSLRHGDHYVQFAQDPEALTVEAVSNDNLPPDRQLSEQAQRRLADLGWQPAELPWHDNWWDEQPWPISSATARTVAERLVRTLREVFAVPEPGELAYRAWHYATGEPLDWSLFDGLIRQA